MTKNCAFTICTKNYLGLAEVLRESIYKYCDDLDFYIFIADEKDGIEFDSENVFFIKELDLFSKEVWENFSFKYDLTEFCTTMKPFMFKYIFQNFNYENVCYFDPDILFFDSIKEIYDNFIGNVQITLTPHFITFPQTDVSKKLEDELRLAGLYNLGFLGLKKTKKTLQMLDWWGDNLSNKGFSDPDKIQFTDQKWMDFMTLYFSMDEICILRNIGCNIAPWNFFEREIICKDSTFYVKFRESRESDLQRIIFVHYSGFNYKKLFSEGVIEEKHSAHKVDYLDVNLLMSYYGNILHSYEVRIEKFLSLSYSYNYFSNGDIIQKIHRRLYDSFYRNIEKIESPFDINGEFYKLLRKNKLIWIDGFSDKDSFMQKNKDAQLKKVRILSKLFILAYKILGVKKYTLFLKCIKKMSKVENQLFLLKKAFVVFE